MQCASIWHPASNAVQNPKNGPNEKGNRTRSRVDDMVNVRGVNVYPSAVEAVVRRFEEVVEYRATVMNNGALCELSLEIELAPGSVSLDERIAGALRDALGLTVPVRIVGAGALPRFEMKARRFVVT
jgi:phenylacetate-CoA ligase